MIERDLTWKTIPGYTDYEISEYGQIRSQDRNKVYRSGRKMTHQAREKRVRKHPKNGFLMTDLIDNSGKRHTVYPHKLVAIVFLSKQFPRKQKVVFHLDGDVENNHFSNLKWCTVSESIRRGFENGTRDNSNLWEKRRAKYGPKGGNKSMGRPDPLDEEKRKEILTLRTTSKITLTQLATRFNCSVSHIHKTIKIAELKTA
jgi:hypothetical protein